MADTAFASNSNLTVKQWSASLYRQALKKIFFGRFVGEDDNSIIQKKTELMTKAGDKIVYGLRMNLTGAGKTDDDTMEGNEEAMVFYDWGTTIHLRKNAVKAAGKMSMRRTMFDIRQEARGALSDWIKNLIDDDTVLALSGLANPALTETAVAPSTNHKWKGGQTTAGVITSVATDALITNAACLFGTSVISVIKRKAQLSNPIIRPTLIKGKDYYVMLVHPYQAKALKQEAAWQQAQREANVRSEDNPIFSGALGIWDGVVIHEYDRILTRAPAGTFESGDAFATGVNGARALFLGAQAGVHAYGQLPTWKEKMFEYDTVPGVYTDLIYRADKTRYNSEDFGVITVDTAIIPD